MLTSGLWGILASPMPIICKQCGASNHSGNYLCLMCGGNLSETPEPLGVQPTLPGQPALTQANELLLARMTPDPATPTGRRVRTEAGGFRAGRFFALALFCLAVAVASWQWQNLRTLAGRLSKSRAATQPMTNSAALAASVDRLASEGVPTADLASKRNPNTNDENSSADVPQEGMVHAVTPSKTQIEPANSSSPGSSTTSETEGEKYLYGDGVQVNCDRAQKDLVVAAKQSNPKAESVLGTMYATGHCAARDLPLAYYWFAQAERHGVNRIIEEDMKVLWSQMSPEERKVAVRQR